MQKVSRQEKPHSRPSPLLWKPDGSPSSCSGKWGGVALAPSRPFRLRFHRVYGASSSEFPAREPPPPCSVSKRDALTSRVSNFLRARPSRRRTWDSPRPPDTNLYLGDPPDSRGPRLRSTTTHCSTRKLHTPSTLAPNRVSSGTGNSMHRPWHQQGRLRRRSNAWATVKDPSVWSSVVAPSASGRSRSRLAAASSRTSVGAEKGGARAAWRPTHLRLPVLSRTPRPL